MTAETKTNPRNPSARTIWLAIIFVAIWAIVGPLVMPPEGKRIMEDAAAYSGRLFGHGAAFGLVAAVLAHLAVLRRSSGKTRTLVYAVGILAGGLCSLLVNS